MLVCKSLFMVTALAALSLMSLPLAAESIVIGGIEDHAGSTPFEGMGDYNDLIFSLLGNVSVLAASAEQLAFNSSVVDQTGTVFWDNQSFDGNDTNFGYCVLGGGACNADAESGVSLDYVANAGGGDPLSELFQATGSITATLLVTDTSNAKNNTLGWYDPSNPGVLHPIFAGGAGLGTVVTFVPSATFALYSSNGVGEFYSSMASANMNEVTTDQHFALVQGLVPEPATGPLAAAVLALACVGRILWRRSATSHAGKTA